MTSLNRSAFESSAINRIALARQRKNETACHKIDKENEIGSKKNRPGTNGITFHGRHHTKYVICIYYSAEGETHFMQNIVVIIEHMKVVYR